MRGITIAIMLVLPSIECHAQTTPNPGQCEQVRAAVQQHGLQAARKHAMENYGLSLADLRNIEQGCGIGGRERDPDRSRRAKQ